MGREKSRCSTTRKLRSLLPSRQYLKLYAWTIGIFYVALLVLFCLFGRYLGYADVWMGVLLISFMMAFAFLGALIFGVVLQIIDPD